MWNWNLFENSAVIAEGRRRSICSFLVAIIIGSLLLALISIFPPNTPGFYGVLIGGSIIILMGLAGFVIMCVYYPMDCCRRGGSVLQNGTVSDNNYSIPETVKPPTPAPEYIAPPSYDKAVANMT